MRQYPSPHHAVTPGDTRLPDDFGERLAGLKTHSGLTWEAMAESIGVDSRQLLRWRRGSCPNGGAMLSLVRWAGLLPNGLEELLGEEWAALARSGR